MIVVLKKEKLIEELEAVRPRLEKDDARAVLKHKQAEKAFFTAWRKSLREAMKWDYAQAKKKNFDVRVERFAPSCPYPSVNKLDRVLAAVKASQQQKYRIQPNGWTREIHELLFGGEKTKKSVCD